MPSSRQPLATSDKIERFVVMSVVGVIFGAIPAELVMSRGDIGMRIACGVYLAVLVGRMAWVWYHWQPTDQG